MGFYWVIPFPSRNWIHEYRAIYLFEANNKDTKKKVENVFKINNQDTRTASLKFI